MKFRVGIPFLLALLMLLSCSGPYHLKDVRVSQTRINSDSLKLVDLAIVKMIAPYKAKLDSQMGEVLAVSEVDLIKERPEGTLCNLVTEALMAYGNKTHDKRIDLCVLNYGGIRLPSISKGNITLGRIFELMPFDNQIEVLEIDGATCRLLLDIGARTGGWPVSGVRLKINNMIAEDVVIGGQLLDMNKTYTLITSDYLANGNDGAGMLLKATKRTPLNYKVRDAIADYLRDQKSNNQPINLHKDGRVTVVEPEKVH